VTQELLSTLGRRAAQRICLRADVGILDEKTGARDLGRLCDLSATGACARSPRPLTIGQEVRLAFEFDPGQEPVRLHAEVVWSTRDSRAKSNGYLAGLRFLDLATPDARRLRDFIERKLRTVKQFLNSFELLNGLGELEKALISSVCFDRELLANESLEFGPADDTLVLVRSGRLMAVESDPDGKDREPRTVRPGEFCGTLPIDPRGALRLRLRASEASGVLCIPSDGFWYLWSTHAETALKILSCWALSLRDRLLTTDAGG